MLELIDWIFSFQNFDNWLNYNGVKLCAYLLHLVSFNCSVLHKDKFT
uniref:Uncharacterized protein n=1 Tax=Panthera tigris altaica TaxID=74533 RepID=A0A8C9JJE0_PANTA